MSYGLEHKKYQHYDYGYQQTENSDLDYNTELPSGYAYSDSSYEEDLSKEYSKTHVPTTSKPVYRTEKPKLQIPHSLIPTLPPFTISSPSPFTVRHYDQKRSERHDPPRVIISASASVSDATGRRLNYSLGTIEASHLLGTPPHSYDEYKESDVVLDPFYYDVPKVGKKSRSKRQTRRGRTKFVPPDYVDDNYEPLTYEESSKKISPTTEKTEEITKHFKITTEATKATVSPQQPKKQPTKQDIELYNKLLDQLVEEIIKEALITRNRNKNKKPVPSNKEPVRTSPNNIKIITVGLPQSTPIGTTHVNIASTPETILLNNHMPSSDFMHTVDSGNLDFHNAPTSETHLDKQTPGSFQKEFIKNDSGTLPVTTKSPTEDEEEVSSIPSLTTSSEVAPNSFLEVKYSTTEKVVETTTEAIVDSTTETVVSQDIISTVTTENSLLQLGDITTKSLELEEAPNDGTEDQRRISNADETSAQTTHLDNENSEGLVFQNYENLPTESFPQETTFSTTEIPTVIGLNRRFNKIDSSENSPEVTLPTLLDLLSHNSRENFGGPNRKTDSHLEPSTTQQIKIESDTTTVQTTEATELPHLETSTNSSNLEEIYFPTSNPENDTDSTTVTELTTEEIVTTQESRSTEEDTTITPTTEFHLELFTSKMVQDTNKSELETTSGNHLLELEQTDPSTNESQRSNTDSEDEGFGFEQKDPAMNESRNSKIGGGNEALGLKQTVPQDNEGDGSNLGGRNDDVGLEKADQTRNTNEGSNQSGTSGSLGMEPISPTRNESEESNVGGKNENQARPNSEKGNETFEISSEDGKRNAFVLEHPHPEKNVSDKSHLDETNAGFGTEKSSPGSKEVGLNSTSGLEQVISERSRSKEDIKEDITNTIEENASTEPIRRTTPRKYNGNRSRSWRRNGSSNSRHRFSSPTISMTPSILRLQNNRRITTEPQENLVTEPDVPKSVNPTESKVPHSTTPLNKIIRNGFNCLDKKLNSFYEDPRDCRLFHYCTHGFSSTQVLDMKFVCDFGTYFDVEKLICTKNKPSNCK